MLSYDKGSNLLTLEKVHNPSLGEHLLLLKDLRESFDKFINEGVYEALESIMKSWKQRIVTTRS